MQKTNWHLWQKFVTCAYYVTDIKRLIEFWIDQTGIVFNDMVMMNICIKVKKEIKTNWKKTLAFIF